MDKREDPVAKAVIEVASRLLQEEGPDALTNRRIARDAGTSTMSIYSRFGAKGGILDALYLEGVQRLSEAQGRVGHLPDARQEVLALCRAWRAEAMAHPGHYRVVFGEPVPGWSPSDALRQQSLRTWLRLRDAVFRAVSARRCAGSPEPVDFNDIGYDSALQ